MVTQEPTPEAPRRGPQRVRRASMNVLGQLSSILAVSAILATLFTAFTPLGLLPAGLSEWFSAQLSGNSGAASNFPTPTPRPRPVVGIVAGHWGSDSGAVCSDGLTEVEVNLDIATRAAQKLTDAGFDVDLLQEFDDKLEGYQALVLVSLHADTCEYIDDNATGFKVAASLTSDQAKTQRLVACLSNRYQQATGLRYHLGSVTAHMSNYHTFNEIHHETTAAIIETGFLNLDRQVLTQNSDVVAEGVAQGVLCYIYNESAVSPEGN
ncbi:MAG: N-acetylmuramoyl-L-alanine amidase [Anaerolineales bacterium]|nr:N-acetylmuramoyl-L-alanine amidase [Anaerolineales bacterium]